MADRPILFSAPMVRALQAGTKTQTRRTINPQPVVNEAGLLRWDIPKLSVQTDAEGLAWHMRISKGDRLYVREHWRISNRWDGTAPRDLEPRGMSVIYEAGGSASNEDDGWRAVDWPGSRELWPHWIGKARRGMHMPRWASRITLTVTDVRVQRLQDISEADSLAEGVEQTLAPHNRLHAFCPPEPFNEKSWDTAREAYAELWRRINGPNSWQANPWIAAYTFTVALGNIDELARAA
jgi:hypothetical protein